MKFLPILIIIVAVIGAPLFSIIALLAIVNFHNSGANVLIVAQEISGITNMPLIHSIPLFTFAGYILAHSRASKRLVRLTKASLGWMPGGLAIVTLFACAFFTAFTGASGITIVALGGFLLPALLSERYEERFSLGLITSSGSLGLLFPPSLPLILFGVIASVSIDKLFIAGVFPGIFLLAVLSLFSAYKAKRFKVEQTKFSIKELRAAIWDMKWEVPLPVLLFGGIYSGIMAISDAASFTVVYILVVELFLTKDIKIRDLPKIIKESMIMVGAIFLILCVSLAGNNYIIDQQIPQQIFNAIQGVITNKWVFLIVLNIFLLVVGCIMDIFSALVVVVPLILPIAQAYNINLIHLGVIFLANLEIGYLTPPVGMNLFISSLRFDQPIIKLYRASLVFIGLLLASLMVITYVPSLSIWFIDKPVVVGKWQPESGMGENLIIKGDGKYMKGDMFQLLAKQGVNGAYTVKGSTITFLSTDGLEEGYRFELFDDGRKLVLKPLVDKESVPVEDDDELAELDELDSMDSSDGTDEFDDSDFDFDDEFNLGNGSSDGSLVYINELTPPLTTKTGPLIARWGDENDFFEFYFNGQVNRHKNGTDTLYSYKVDGNKVTLKSLEQLESDEYSYRFKFKVKKGVLTLKSKEATFTLKVLDSLETM